MGDVTTSADALFSCTIMTTAPGAGHATKEVIAHPVTGLPIKNQARNLGIWKGDVQHIQLAGLAGLGTLLPTLTKRQALIHGVPIGSTPDTILPLVMDEMLGKRGTPAHAIARTLTYFAYTDPHLLMFDIDPDPLDRYVIHTADELIAKLATIWPVFTDVGYLSTVSTSSAIYDKKTGAELTPPYGLHVYVLARGDVARFQDLATIKLWCADTGYCRLAHPNKRTGVAAILERCLTDLSVFSPERLDYVSGAEIDPRLPFAQRRPLPSLHTGNILDLDTLPDATPAERTEYAERLAAAKARIAPERFERCAMHVKATHPELSDDARTKEVTNRLDRANHDWLAPEHVIDLARGGTLLAQDITRKHHGLACADPMEPDYGTNHAKIFWDIKDPHWVICSLAHGFKHLFFPEPQAPEPSPVDDEDMEHLIAQVETQTASHTGLPPEDPAATLDAVSPCTHVANARRIARDYKDRLHYVVGRGWILWEGKYWRTDPTSDASLATCFTGSLGRHIAGEAGALSLAASLETDTNHRKTLMQLSEDRLRWAVESENVRTVAAGLKLSKAALLLDHSATDANPWLFNCQNLTIDLKTGKPQEHNPADLITHISPVHYDAQATCPKWEKFLKAVFADDMDMVAFIQRAMGYSLTGVVRERVLFFLYGPTGWNGKTTMVETFAKLIGFCDDTSAGYARKVDIGTFMRSRNEDDNQRKVVVVDGARFVYTSEVGQGQRLNAQLVKDITGKDTLQGRRLYHEAFNFPVQLKPWMYGNHKPDIRETDDAIWDRVKVIEFTVSFKDPGKLNLELPEQLLAELPGILNWAIQGCLDWQASGLNPPKKVTEATSTYRTEQDVIGQFLNDRCTTLEGTSEKATALYKAYLAWGGGAGRDLVSQTQFGNYLTEHGFLSDHNSSGRGTRRLGLHLQPIVDDDPDGANSCPDDPKTDPPKNDATKEDSPPTPANSANSERNKSPYAYAGEEKGGTTGSTVSNGRTKGAYPRTITGDAPANGSSPTVSTSGTSPPTVGDWVYYFSVDGVQQKDRPSRIDCIELGADGQLYALFRDHDTGWPLAQCEKAMPPEGAEEDFNDIPF
jgi:P4 family phage/plasmid primase-like protien